MVWPDSSGVLPELGGECAMSQPTIMVSSTFYDLRQVRDDLRRFIEDDLGYHALLSEYPSFPIDPDESAIENCRRRVERDADILVLVVGGRYGSVDKRSAQSVTSLEYSTAKLRGIPIYCFVDKQILTLLPVWQQNPDGDYSCVVDSKRLFEFVDGIRSKDEAWTFSFETAQDITMTLRVQFANLFLDTLHLRAKVLAADLARFVGSVSNAALRLILEKPGYWEYRLLFQTWQDAIDRRSDLIREYQAALFLGSSESVSIAETPDWLRTRLHEIHGHVESLGHLVNVSAEEAVGPPGRPGDPDLHRLDHPKDRGSL
jgi:hypothetical protein